MVAQPVTFEEEFAAYAKERPDEMERLLAARRQINAQRRRLLAALQQRFPSQS